MVALLWALAWARKGDEPVPDGPDLAAQEATACARQVPENYQIHTGFAVHADPAEAIALAKADARRQALEALCSGKSEARCAVIRRHLDDWKDPFHNPLTGRACAHVGVNRSWIDDDRREQEAMLAAVRALAVDAASKAAGHPVVLSPAVWADSGCDAGEVGELVLSEIRDALAQQQTRLVPAGTRPSHTVALVARVTGDTVRVDGSVVSTGVQGEIPLKGASFASDLLAMREASRDCRVDAALGLPGGHRLGQGGLQVWVDTGMQGVICEGDRGAPSVAVSAPARVKVWSVDRAGTALLVWPPPGHDGRVEGRLSLGDMDFHPSPGGGEERLVALALPVGASFGDIDAWTGFCKHPTELDLTRWPDAAAASAALAVHRRDEPVCVMRQGPRTQAPPMPAIPTCPARLGG